MEFILDSYAWVEYVLGSKKGEKVSKLLGRSDSELFTLDCCLAELKSWCLRERRNFEDLFRIIKGNSRILSLSIKDWIQAGQERHEQKKSQRDFGLIDAAILVKQKALRCKVVTGDKHFKRSKDVVFLG